MDIATQRALLMAACVFGGQNETRLLLASFPVLDGDSRSDVAAGGVAMRAKIEKWILRSGNRTDAERYLSYGHGVKVRRLIEAWEQFAKFTKWTPVSRLRVDTLFTDSAKPNTIFRLRRRLAMEFMAAGLIDIDRQDSHRCIMVRVRRQRMAL
jgi:hypothetical protein